MKTYILYIDDPVSVQYANDCLASCRQFNVEAALFEGVKGKTNRQLTRETNLRINTTEYSSEYCGTIGHFNIWKAIAESGEVGVILEHDAVVKADYSNLVVNDGEILFLGPRVYSREDYGFPSQYQSIPDYIDVDFYYGAHAYMITPNTAKAMLEELERIEQILMPIDGLLGLRNKFDMKLKAVDPAFVICETNNHKSFNFDKPDTRNRKYFDKFLEGIYGSKLPETEDRIFTVDWFSDNIPHWLETFEFVGKNLSQPLNVLEIGCYEGKSTCWISDHMLKHLGSRLDAIDTFQGSIEHEGQDNDRLKNMYMYNVSLTRNPEKINSYIGDSRVILPILLKEQRKYDVIYVDGGHMQENVIIDGLCAYHLLKDDGVIIFDDYEWTYYGARTVKEGLDILETMIPIKPILTGWQRSYIKST